MPRVLHEAVFGWRAPPLPSSLDLVCADLESSLCLGSISVYPLPHSGSSGDHCDGCMGIRAQVAAAPGPAHLTALEKSEGKMALKFFL